MGSVGLPERFKDLPQGPDGLPLRSEGLPGGGGGVYGRMDEWMDGWNFSPFYRTLSPVGAAAQKALRTKTLS